jgi:hypothetical protein
MVTRQLDMYLSQVCVVTADRGLGDELRKQGLIACRRQANRQERE